MGWWARWGTSKVRPASLSQRDVKWEYSTFATDNSHLSIHFVYLNARSVIDGTCRLCHRLEAALKLDLAGKVCCPFASKGNGLTCLDLVRTVEHGT